MITVGLYLLKVSICLTVFYTLHYIFFRGITFYMLNRVCLLAGLVASFFFPLIHISFSSTVYDTVASQPLLRAFHESFENESFTSPLATPAIPQDVPGLLSMIYLSGIVFMLSKFIVSIFRLVRIIDRSRREKRGNVTTLRTTLGQPFSFLNLIFLPEGENSPIILSHEEGHVVQFHWIDLLLAEATCIILWFNPIAFLYRRAIKLEHEFLADAYALKKGITPSQYLLCMLRQIQVENTGQSVSHFYAHSIKKRIIMITKSKTPTASYMRYLILIPVVSLLLFGFSSPSTLYPEDISSTAENIPDIYPVAKNKVGKITSGYGMRVHPITGKNAFHTGIDFAVALGEPVISTADGIVIESTEDSVRGYFLVIKHSDVYSTSYSHLSSSILANGKVVKKGEQIGVIGGTGLSTAPHLHYEIFRDGKDVDPQAYLPK